ncbi:MAG: tRNA (guanine-N(7)-)-methyltransferase [marine bacterium B5-7]|nr:MAG: tRNA (guanine-N(7)-)-methyltransferase [marine bacterium B5-7]
MKEKSTKRSTIRSYVKREGRLTSSQQNALDNYWDKHGVDFSSDNLNLQDLYNRRAPLILDIGVGTGDSTFNHAKKHPENNYLAIEVHRPGVGQLLNNIESNNLTNIKISNNDVIDVLQNQIPDRSISQVFIFFADPWPKTRHQKRRLINEQLIALIKRKITAHGRLHIATDWQDYAKHIQKLCQSDPALINLSGNKLHSSPRPNWRIRTRYEARGLRLNHNVWDFCYGFYLKR